MVDALSADENNPLGIEVPTETAYTGANRETVYTPRPPEQIMADKRAEAEKIVRNKVWSAMTPMILNSIPQDQQTPKKLRDMEQYMLENYNSMVDLTGEGRVGNTPFLDAKWVLNPKSGSDVSLIPHLEFSGYLVDKLQAGGIDLINGFYAFFGGKAKTVEERRKQAEELRVKTLQFKDDGGIVNQAMESIGFLSEAAPTMAVTLPLAVGTSGLGLGIYATTGLIATEAATVTTIQEWGRVKNNPQWSIYSKNGEEFSYDAMMMATGGDPELMSQYTEDKNTAGKLGYLSNVFGTSMLTDGVTSLLFLKGLKGLSPYNAVTKDMSSWWRYHAASAGYAVPQGSVANSFASMQQYIAQQEALGREATWAEVKQVGYDAALAGGLTAATVSTIGSVSNLVLAQRS